MNVQIKDTIIEVGSTKTVDQEQPNSILVNVYDRRYPKHLGFNLEFTDPDILSNPNNLLLTLSRVFVDIAKKYKEVDPRAIDEEITFYENFLDSLKEKKASLMTREGEIELR